MSLDDRFALRWAQEEPVPPRVVQRIRPEHLEVVLDCDLFNHPVDFGSDCVVFERETGQTRFVGTVERFQRSADLLLLALVDGSQDLKEGVLRGFVIKPGSSNLRLMHAMLRHFGTPDDKMHLDGYVAPPLNSPYRVVVPVAGEVFPEPLRLGPVLLTSDPAAHADLDSLPFEAKGLTTYRDAFRAASAWAIAEVTAQLLCDAERAGLSAVAEALAAYVASRRYTLSHLPEGDIRPGYQRIGATLCNVHYEPLAYTASADLGDGWFRSLDATQNSAQGGAFLSNVMPADVLDVFSTEERAALTSWHEAVTLSGRRELVRCLDALWRGFEYYATGTRVSSLFSGEDLDRLLSERPTWFSDDQWRKYERTVREALPSPPLLPRVWEAAQRDGVPLLIGETESVGTVRKVRNRLSHGKSATAGDTSTINVAIRVLNRLLVYRAHTKSRLK